MCGRYTLTKKEQALLERFEAEIAARFDPNYNAAPTQELPVITGGMPGKIQMFRWGLVPAWAKDKSIGVKMINARAESVSEKPSFRDALKSRRCLVPADGFYEWQASDSGKRPFRITLKDRGLFAFAGLWDEWKAPDGNPLFSFTIVTTQANGFMKPIHDRMPVILPREKERAWIDSKLPAADTLAFLAPCPDNWLSAYPVSMAVNNVRNQGPELVERIE